MPTCPTCQSSTCVKAGIVRNKQRYKCKTCRYFFTEPASHTRGYSADLKQQALAMVLDGNGIRQAARHTGVSHVSILNWIKQTAQAIEVQPVEKADVIEMDEMWHYVQKKE
jgi:transposase-like protein